MTLNLVVIGGNLTRDPELRYTIGGMAVANFSVAINRVYYVDKEKKEEVSFIPVTVFGKAAENCNQYLEEGRQVVVTGRLKQDRWEDKNDGSKRSKINLIATNVQFIGGQRQEETHQGTEDHTRPANTTPRTEEVINLGG